jgi:hypothetical protein
MTSVGDHRPVGRSKYLKTGRDPEKSLGRDLDRVEVPNTIHDPIWETVTNRQERWASEKVDVVHEKGSTC